MTSRALRSLAAALAVVLAVPAAAGAQGSFIDGDPLNVYANGLGRFQVRHDGAPAADLAPDSNSAANAGLNLGFYSSAGVAGPLIGFLGNDKARGDGEFVSIRPPTVSGDGSPGNPFVLSSSYRAPGRSGFTPTVSPYLTVNESIRYVNGTSEVLTAYLIRSTDTRVRFRASLVGDLFHLTSSEGSGFFQPGPARYVGGVNLAAGAAGGVLEEPQVPWSAHEVDDVGTLFAKVRSPGGPGFDGSVTSAFLDDAAGVQWDNWHPPNSLLGSAVIGAYWRVPHFNGLTLDPPSAVAAVGQTHEVRARFETGGTLPVGDREIRFEVTGANPTGGSVFTDPSGDATIVWPGANAGEDALAAFVDLDGDDTRDPNEPQAIANVEFQPPFGNPTRGVSFNVEPLRGEVLVAEQVELPEGARTAALTEFRKLTSPAQIRIGSVLDTKRGVVRMTMARNADGTETQTGDFSRGRFAVAQSEAAPMTVLSLRGGRFRRCGRDLRKHGAASTARHRRTIRRLRGSARGRFRTRGRRSSATVRGTIWDTRDSCLGTLTRVIEGSVKVRDFAKRRTIVLRRGKRYLARSRRR